jgi:hypothetical protein
VQCSQCDTFNAPTAAFCSQCGHKLEVAAAAPAAPPSVPAGGAAAAGVAPGVTPVFYAVPGDPAHLPYRPYWVGLLIGGVIASVVGWLLVIAGLHSAATDVANSLGGSSSGSSDAGGELVFGILLAGLGGLLLLPGIIGWGIHASGLTRKRRSAPEGFTSTSSGRSYAFPLSP